MRFTYSITPEDYRRGNRIMCLHTLPERRRNHIFNTWAAPAFAVGALVAGIGLLFQSGSATGPPLACFAFSAVMVWVRVSYPLKLKRYYKQQKLGSQLEVQADAEAIHLQRQDGLAETRYSWPLFDGWFESGEQFTLFPNQRTFIPVPKRVLAPEQQNELRALLTAHIPRKN
jgi:YcxB-like protein